MRSPVRRWNVVWWVASKAWTKWLAREFESFGRDSIFLLPGWFFGTDKITIGKQVWIGPVCRMGALWGAKLTIGDGTEIIGGSPFFAQTEGIEIGGNVLMAWNVQIYDPSTRRLRSTRRFASRGSGGGRVRIGDGAWLGSNAVVLQGVTIGRNGVIGANSVVTKDVPDCATAAGIPAVVIKERSPAPAGDGATAGSELA